MSRFEGCRALYKQARSGGVGAFTADNFPVFDWVKPNVYAILDSNHGYKMIGVGREVAKVLCGDTLAALPVPLRALRDRRPAPGLQLAVSLVASRVAESDAAADASEARAARDARPAPRLPRKRPARRRRARSRRSTR